MAAAVATHSLFLHAHTDGGHDTCTETRPALPANRKGYPTLRGPEDGASEEALVQLARKGNRAAFIALIGRYERRIYRLALRMSRNRSDAEEITQEAFLRAHGSIGLFKGEARFGTWLYRIALNEALMRRRAAKRRPVASLDDVVVRFADLGTLACAQMDADDLIDGKRLARRVRQAVEQLDEAHRAALVLRDIDELTAEQVGEVLGISPEAVRQRSHRARLKLRELLADLEDLLPGHAKSALLASREKSARPARALARDPLKVSPSPHAAPSFVSVAS